MANPPHCLLFQVLSTKFFTPKKGPQRCLEICYVSAFTTPKHWMLWQIYKFDTRNKKSLVPPMAWPFVNLRSAIPCTCLPCLRALEPLEPLEPLGPLVSPAPWTPGACSWGCLCCCCPQRAWPSGSVPSPATGMTKSCVAFHEHLGHQRNSVINQWDICCDLNISQPCTPFRFRLEKSWFAGHPFTHCVILNFDHELVGWLFQICLFVSLLIP